MAALLPLERRAFPILCYPGKAQHKPKTDKDKNIIEHRWYVELTSAYGNIGGYVSEEVFRQAQELQGEPQVVADCIPVNEQQPGSYVPGYLFRLTPQRIRKVPAEQSK